MAEDQRQLGLDADFYIKARSPPLPLKGSVWLPPGRQVVICCLSVTGQREAAG